MRIRFVVRASVACQAGDLWIDRKPCPNEIHDVPVEVSLGTGVPIVGSPEISVCILEDSPLVLATPASGRRFVFCREHLPEFREWFSKIPVAKDPHE